MFTSEDDSLLCWFNPASLDTDEFKLIGSLVGLAIYNDVLLSLPFPLALYKRLQREEVYLEDLAILRPQLAKGLQALLDYTGDVADFCRTFVGTYESFGEVIEIPLVEGGEYIPVTSENRQGGCNLTLISLGMY